MPALDIKTAVQTAFFLAIFGIVASIWLVYRNINSAKRMPFFLKRRKIQIKTIRFIVLAIFFFGVSIFFNQFAEPAIYLIFPPSPTITLTPTITNTPTITMTPTITLTPTITYTPAISPTPFLPESIQELIEITVVPNTEVAFSPLVFSKEIDEEIQPVNPLEEFGQPITTIYATFSYISMMAGDQWSALWYRLNDAQLVCYETKPWDGGTGGYGYSDCSLESSEWLPGTYEVQFFVGFDWKVSGRFTVTGIPPTATYTVTATATQTNTATITPTLTPLPTNTSTRTPTRTNTSTVTLTPTKTRTPTATNTIRPTVTPGPTDTRWPSMTPTPIN
jgi:type VI secretion system secreted protein VgrG